MKPKRKAILPSLAALVLCGTGLFLFNRDSSSLKASEPLYQSLSANLAQKYKQFTDLKCLAIADLTEVREAVILRDTNDVSPKGVPSRQVLVAIKIVTPYETVYALQGIGYRKGKCGAYYAGGSSQEDPVPLSRTFSKEEAHDVALLFYRWQLANVPNWKSDMQKRLNRTKVLLAEEQFWALKQLGFKMPKKWQEIK